MKCNPTTHTPTGVCIRDFVVEWCGFRFSRRQNQGKQAHVQQKRSSEGILNFFECFSFRLWDPQRDKQDSECAPKHVDCEGTWCEQMQMQAICQVILESSHLKKMISKSTQLVLKVCSKMQDSPRNLNQPVHEPKITSPTGAFQNQKNSYALCTSKMISGFKQFKDHLHFQQTFKTDFVLIPE